MYAPDPPMSQPEQQYSETAARLLADIGAMPAAAATAQELAQKASALQSMLYELHKIANAV